MNKLVFAFVDNTGFKLTGRYLDRYCLHPETASIPEGRACVWSDYSKKRLKQLKTHVEQSKSEHEWVGYFVMPDSRDILDEARRKALAAFSNK